MEYNISKEEIKTRLHDIYSQIPEFNCKGCGNCCGPIRWYFCEDILIKDYMEKNNINYVRWEMADYKKKKFKCPYLTKDKQCIIYEVRPILCRLKGTTKKLPCIRKKQFKLSKEQANSLMMKVVDIDLDLLGVEEMMKQEVLYEIRSRNNDNGNIR